MSPNKSLRRMVLPLTVLIVFSFASRIVYAGGFTELVPITGLDGTGSSRNGVFALGQGHLLFSSLPSSPTLRQIKEALANLHPAPGFEYLDGASRITYNNGYLVALIPAASAIRYINLLTKSTGAIDVSPVVSGASLDIALSDSGILAITNDAKNRIRLISLASPKKLDKTFEGIFAKNVRSPTWVGDILYILRDNQEQCIGLDLPSLISSSEAADPIRRINSPRAQISRLYSWRGVLYFETDEAIYSLPATKKAAFGYEFSPWLIKGGHFTAFAIVGPTFVVFDMNAQAWSVQPRVIPAVIGMYGLPKDNIQHLTAIYKYLRDSESSVSFRELSLVGSSRDPIANSQAFLPASAQQLPIGDLKSLFETICSKQSCVQNADSKKDTAQIALPPSVVEKPDVLVLDLKNQSLEATLARKGMSKQSIYAMRDDILRENIIPNSYEDFVSRPLAYLYRTGIKESDRPAATDRYLLPTRLTKNIRAGSLLRLKGDQLIPLGQEVCVPEHISRIPGNLSLEITRPDVIATAIDEGLWSSSMAKAPSTFVSLSGLSWHQVARRPDADSCDRSEPDLFLVSSTVTAEDVSIVVQGSEAVIRQIKADQPTVGAWVQSDSNRLDLKQSGERVLAFQVTPLTGKTNAVVSEAQLNAQFIALVNSTSGTVRIPIKAWFTGVYLTSNELAEAFSNQSTALASTDVRVFPLELDTPIPQFRVSPTANANDDSAILTESHKAVRTAINIFDSTSILQSTARRPIIGIAESETSLDMSHPLLSGVNWYPSLVNYQPCDPEAMNQLKQCDHGTFITGLLGGKEAIDPVLAAKLQLHFIPLEDVELSTHIANATRICDNIDPASDGLPKLCGIHVINFSQAYDDQGTAAAITSALKSFEGANDRTKEVIFIAAADDNVRGQMPANYAEPLLSFLREKGLSQLIIGVSEGSSDSIPPAVPHSKDFINLIAPGKTMGPIIKGTVGVKEGTSVAVPQVAVAAVLIASQQGTVGKVKARLIYTADPLLHGYDDDVWGGYLNVFRAASFLNDGLLVLPPASSIQYRVQTEGIHNITVSGYLTTPFYERIPLDENKTINVSNVLRIALLADKKWRVIYLDDGELKIATATKIGGNIEFRYIGSVVEVLDNGTKTFVTRDLPPALLSRTETIPAERIQDYTAPISKVVPWWH